MIIIRPFLTLLAFLAIALFWECNDYKEETQNIDPDSLYIVENYTKHESIKYAA